MENTQQAVARWLLGRRVPLVVKLAYTAFVCVMVPFYLRAYGPTNFLYFCDVAVFLTLASVWLEWPLPASMAAVGITIPQMLWVADFGAGLLGLRITGMTAYMFDPGIPLFARGISLFHGWLPFLLLYLVWRLGYDRRALLAWTLLAWALMLVCYFLMPAPPRDPNNPNVPVNIDYVYGLSDDAPQTWMPPLAWLALMMTALPVLFFVPTHRLLRALAPPAPPDWGSFRGQPLPSPEPPGVPSTAIQPDQRSIRKE
jgi:hypothetical protein